MRSIRFALACALAVAYSVSISSNCFAFDGSRKGFVLGFGAGPGALIPFEGLRSDLPAFDLQTGHPAFGLQTDLKMGLGLSDRVLIHYTGKLYWDGTLVDALPLLGVTYYLGSAGRSGFVSGGLGVGLVAAGEWNGPSGDSSGPAGYLGAGYEFAHHWQLEFDVVGQGANNDITAIDLALTLNVLGY